MSQINKDRECNTKDKYKSSKRPPKRTLHVSTVPHFDDDDDDDDDDVYLIESTTCGLYKIYRLYALT